MVKVRIGLRRGALATLTVLAGSCGPAPLSAPTIVPELAGRTAGPAQACVSIVSTSGLRIAGPSTILYGSGSTIWANHLPSQCLGNSMDVLVTHPTGSQYCRGDIVLTMQPYGGIPGPSCVLGDFVPYRR